MHGLTIEEGGAPLAETGISTTHLPRTADESAKRPLSAGRPRMGLAAKLSWSAAGFLIGAAFWHVVGFWSFVSTVVLGNPEAERQAAASFPLMSVASAGETLNPRTVASAAKARQACVTAVLDRATGETRLEPCESSAVTLPLVAASAREDRAQPALSTGSTILPQSDVQTTRSE